MAQHHHNQNINNANNPKDPVSYERLREAFIRDLQHFHDSKGTTFKKIPKFNGKEVDLYKLYTVVTSKGGWMQVNSKNEWAWLCEEFHLPNGCVNSGVGLKQIYLRYLDRYEKVHFLGEDGHPADDDDDHHHHSSRHRHGKLSVRSLHSVPLTYNHNQHNIAESLREYNGLSSSLYKPSNYDKLALSLLSPLPNEQDFAINVCTLLSNEGKHTLRLDKYPRLVNHLLAHAGVFDSPGTRQLFIEVYSRVRNYSINSFWSDVLEVQDVIDLTDERRFLKKFTATAHKVTRRKTLNDTSSSYLKTTANNESNQQQQQQQQMEVDEDNDNDDDEDVVECVKDSNNDLEIIEESLSSFHDQNQNSIKFQEEDRDLFCVGRTLGTQDPYGQRVLQIASILRNLSFTPENAAILGKNSTFIRFVLLCIRSRWSNLHQLGFDTLGNIANEIVLKQIDDRLRNCILTCVSKGINSQDRFIIISCLETLNRVSQQDLNEEIVTLGLDKSVYEVICRFLALSDIALLVYTLECLYALTCLGERPCTSVARVRGAIDTLVALVTVEAQSYGPKACILMRVVETVSTIPASQQQQQQQQQSQQQDQMPLKSQQNPQHSHASQNQAVLHTQPQAHQIQHIQPAQPVQVVHKVAKVQPQAMSNVQNSANSPGPCNSPNTVAAVLRPSTPARTPSPAQPQPQQATQQLQTQIHVSSPTAQIQTLTPAQTQTVNAPPSTPSQPPVSTSPVVKTVAASTSTRTTTPKSSKAAAAAANSLIQQHSHQQIIQENEQFALTWLKNTFELSPGVEIEQEELYKKYLSSCTKIGRRGVIAPLHFPRCVRSVFGTAIGPNSLKGDSSGALYYEGIQVRATPLQVVTQASPITAIPANSGNPVKVLQRINVHNSNPLPDSTVWGQLRPPSSPILKAQLSAPPKPNLNDTNTLSVNPNTNVVLESKSQVSVAHPHLSQALLSSGGQQQPQIQQVQVIMKDNCQGAPSTSIIKSLLATKVTVSGDCMTSAAVSCVSTTTTACITNTTSINANQIITSNQVAQRQQHQRLLQQQQMVVQKAATTPVTTVVAKTPKTNAKSKGKKVQRLNGAKIIFSNNCEKSEVLLNNPNASQVVAFATMQSENHISRVIKTVRQAQPTNTANTIVLSKSNQIQPNSIPAIEDSDSTNNSIASSSGIGGSRECSGAGLEEENSLTSFEGILLNGVQGGVGIDVQDEEAKELLNDSCKEKPLQSMRLADLLERKVDKEPMINGILCKKDLIENHIKNVLKAESSLVDSKFKIEVSEDALIEAPQGIKRPSTDDSEIDTKKIKYSNGTVSPDFAIDQTNPESTASSIKSEEQDDEKAQVSSTAANLYAALAADIIEDETDLEETLPVKEEVKPDKEEPVVKREIDTQEDIINQVALNQIGNDEPEVEEPQIPPPQIQQMPQQQPQQQQQVILTHPQIQQSLQQQGIIVAGPRQIVVQQGLQSNNQVIIPSNVKTRTAQIQPQVLLQQNSAGAPLQYIVSGGVPGQNYVLAQPQTALVQGQAQTVLVAQQQGTGTKTIIILQSQAASQQSQKMVAVTPQGQQVVVAQVPRPMVQASTVNSVNPPPLAVTTNAVSQTLVMTNNTVTTQNTSVTQQQSVPTTIVNPTLVQQVQQQPIQSFPSNTNNTSVTKVVTPSPASTPPPARPATPYQTTTPVVKSISKNVKTVSVNSSTSTEADSKPSISTNNPEPKTITIKIDPNAFLCEWRGCLRQFKSPQAVFMHVTNSHCPTDSEEVLCSWPNCDNLKRRRFSLMTHLYDRHCNPDTMASRRKQLTASGKTEVTTSTVSSNQHPGYAPNAAFHAIKRHALEFVNPKELMQRPTKPAASITSSSSPRPGQNPPPEQDDNEGPVTKSIRLTAALILRNLVIYSAQGRRHLRAYEPHLAGVALSNVESSRTIAQVLYDLNEQTSSGHR